MNKGEDGMWSLKDAADALKRHGLLQRQEPCDDTISRRAMHIEFEKWITYGEYKYSNATKYLYDRIDRLPSVTPKQKMGRWKRKIVDNGYNADWICSECGHREMIDFPTKYCPNCGAKMEGEQ